LQKRMSNRKEKYLFFSCKEERYKEKIIMCRSTLVRWRSKKQFCVLRRYNTIQIDLNDLLFILIKRFSYFLSISCLLFFLAERKSLLFLMCLHYSIPLFSSYYTTINKSSGECMVSVSNCALVLFSTIIYVNSSLE